MPKRGVLERLATSTMPIKLPPKPKPVPVESTTTRVVGRFTIIDEPDSKGGARIIHTGPRGGRYMMVHGKKVYLPKV